MPKYTSSRQRNLKVGITSYTDSLTVLEVTGGAYISSSVGIGTTVASQSLHVQGNARISGAVYDSSNVPGSPGQVLQSTATGTLWTNSSNVGIPTYASSAGIATYANYANYAGIATYANYAGIATYADRAGIATYADRAGIATYADRAGIATYSNYAGIATYSASAGIATFATNSGLSTYSLLANIAIYADVAGIATYANRAGISTYANYAGIATYANYAGIATYANYAGIATYADVSGIATYANRAGVATYADYAGIATYAPNAGIATIAQTAFVSQSVIGGIASVTQLSVSGITTLGTVQISSGVINATSGIVSYFGDGAGLINIQASAIVGGTGYVDYAGVSTSVIGGIASVRSLYVSGISTLGTVLVSSGIVTATVGVVTYYGDGSNLTGISNVGNQLTITDKSSVSSPIYPTLATNTGTSEVGISSNKLSFIPSTAKLGLGTGVPRENLDVVGTIGIQSAGSSNRFYLQHNPSESSIDFIFI